MMLLQTLQIADKIPVELFSVMSVRMLVELEVVDTRVNSQLAVACYKLSHGLVAIRSGCV